MDRNPGRRNMHPLDRWKSRTVAAIAAGVLTAGVAYPAAAGATSAAPSAVQTRADQTGGVASTPASGTPSLTNMGKGTQEVIKQLVQCGGTMYAVGQFTSITQHKVAYQ